MTAFDQPTTVNAACTHPRATHRHGTYACYVLDACRCDDCRPVAVAYRREEGRLKAYRRFATDDRYERYVDAARARAHVQELTAAGLGFKRVAAKAGVASSAVGALLWATPSRGRGLRERITRETEAKILSVPVPAIESLAPGRKVDATPTRNRLRALCRLGYSASEIAKAADLDCQPVRRVINGFPTTTVRSHNAVRDVFLQLWNKPCQPDEWRAKIAASRTRRRALEAHWPSAIDLDDDGYLERTEAEDDDPAPTKLETNLNEWKHLVLASEHPARAARRCGTSLAALERGAHRIGRKDVLTLISRAKEVA